MMRPQRHGFLYATILMYALGIANHQTIVVMAAPFMASALALGLLSVWDRRPWRTAVVMPALSAFWELVVARCLVWRSARMSTRGCRRTRVRCPVTESEHVHSIRSADCRFGLIFIRRDGCTVARLDGE